MFHGKKLSIYSHAYPYIKILHGDIWPYVIISDHIRILSLYKHISLYISKYSHIWIYMMIYRHIWLTLYTFMYVYVRSYTILHSYIWWYMFIYGYIWTRMKMTYKSIIYISIYHISICHIIMYDYTCLYTNMSFHVKIHIWSNMVIYNHIWLVYVHTDFYIRVNMAIYKSFFCRVVFDESVSICCMCLLLSFSYIINIKT